MSQSTIAIIILLVALVMYIIPRIPLSVTTILAMLAMAAFKIIDWSSAFAGFASSATLLVAFMMVIGQAIKSTGLASKIGDFLYRFAALGERKFGIIVFIFTIVVSAFLNGALVVAALMPILDAVTISTDGKIRRKHTYFTLGVGSVIGNNLTTIASSSTQTALGVFESSGLGTLGIFDPTIANLPAAIVVIVLYILFGYKIQEKLFNFEEIPVIVEDSSISNGEPQKHLAWNWRMILTILVLVGTITIMIMGANFGASALLGASILMITGCVGEKEAYRSINWTVVIIIAGAIGFSSGLSQSGAGEVIAKWLINVSGPIGQSPWGICILLMFIAQVLSSVMSDNATVAIVLPIGLALATSMGANPLPFVLAVSSGAKVAICTPISVATMTMIQVPGYRFKDYFILGGAVNLITLIAVSITLKLVYFM